jgi:hypothetical protein
LFFLSSVETDLEDFFSLTALLRDSVFATFASRRSERPKTGALAAGVTLLSVTEDRLAGAASRLTGVLLFLTDDGAASLRMDSLLVSVP